MIHYHSSEDLLKTTNLGVTFKEKIIIRNIGTDAMPFCVNNTKRDGVQQGQIIAVLGRSGRGKSTFFKTLVGVLEPTVGKVEIAIHNNPGSFKLIKEGDIGYVQQVYPLSRNQTILAMLQDAAIQGNVSNAKEVIETYLEEWGLKDQKNHSPNQLSGGQRQRVAIIEQLLCSHHFMIFDEPFSGLDVCNIQEVKESFAKINTSNDINTIIFSTHDIEIAVELADHIYIIGYEKNEANQYIPGGTIVGSYDLKAMGIAWQSFGENHLQLVNSIKNQLAIS
jgi:ABC-type multidrug transport system ATPase subunit